MSLYDPFSKNDLSEDKNSIVINCLIHMLSKKSIHTDDFKRFIKNEAIGGDVDWGIEKWDIYSDQDHGIKDKFDGYLFFIDPDEHGDLDRGELQVILTKDQIKPYISNIIDWYKNIPNSNVDEFIELVQENGFL